MSVVLVLVLLVPAVGALLAAVLPDLVGRWAGTVAAAAALALTVVLGFDRPHWTVGAAPIQPWHAVDASWVPALNLRSSCSPRC
jgi:NADH-quinone oxidoreductase subunit M